MDFRVWVTGATGVCPAGPANSAAQSSAKAESSLMGKLDEG